MCPRCKLPKVETHSESANGSPRLPAIDGVYSSCCCPDIRMPDGKFGASRQFVRRHSSLWEKDALSPGLDSVCEDEKSTTNPWDTRLVAPIPVAFEAKNMPEGGHAINILDGHGEEHEDPDLIKANWAHRTRAGSELLTRRSSVHTDT